MTSARRLPWQRWHGRLDIRLVAVLVSCLFSLITIAADPLLNDDAFGYLRAAERFAEEGLRPVLDNYGWYGYSVLIALAEPLLPGGLLASAHLLNAAAYGLLVFSFITLAGEYRDSRRIRVFAALVILGFPLINEMRHFLIRDFGFWAFCLLALLQLVRYHRQTRGRHALGWCLTILAATLFRLEGLVLLTLAPLSLLVNPTLDPVRRVRAYLLILALLLAGVALVFVAALATGIDLVELIQYAYRYYLPRLYNLFDLVQATADQLNRVIFAPQNFPGNSSHGVVILILAYVYTMAVNLVHALGLPFAMLLLYGLVTRQYRIGPHAWLPALFFIGASLASLLIFLFIMHFLTQRYAALACIVLLSFLPLALDGLYDRALNRGRTLAFHLGFGFLLLYLVVDSLISFGYSKRYIEEAVAWTREHLQEGDTLITNEYAIAYFSGRVAEYDRIPLTAHQAARQAEAGDYLALEVGHDDEEARTLLDGRDDLRTLARFSNERDDVLVIYRVSGAPAQEESASR